MNVFVLNTGRCGSMTFIAACRHISNFTAGHESRIHLLGDERLAYPQNHIEADNRLSWLLGRLETAYGDNAYYVHLTRDRAQVAGSFSRRGDYGIMKAYRDGILLREGLQQRDDNALAYDYIDTIEANIALFLRNKSRSMEFRLELAKSDFEKFWVWVGATGDFQAAIDEWHVRHNATIDI